MRLIDADAMLETLKRKYPQWYTGKPKDSWMHYAWLVYHQAVENAPTVDAVPVVRCMDCRYYQDNNGGYPNTDCKWCKDETPDANDYCSCGERNEKAKGEY